MYVEIHFQLCHFLSFCESSFLKPIAITMVQMLDQSVWLEDVDRTINDSKKLTMNVVGRLVDDGSVRLEKTAALDRGLKLHSLTSKKLVDLKKQLSRAKSLEKLILTLLGPGYDSVEMINVCREVVAEFLTSLVMIGIPFS
jgi:hypothetical protein